MYSNHLTRRKTHVAVNYKYYTNYSSNLVGTLVKNYSYDSMHWLLNTCTPSVHSLSRKWAGCLESYANDYQFKMLRKMINIIKIARRFELRKSRNYQPTLGEED